MVDVSSRDSPSGQGSHLVPNLPAHSREGSWSHYNLSSVVPFLGTLLPNRVQLLWEV